MKLFWFLWSIDAIMAAIVLYFFVVGLLDGTVTTRNGLLWFVLLLVLGAVLGGSIYLIRQPKLVAAYLVLSVLALPALIILGYTLYMIFGNVRWN